MFSGKKIRNGTFGPHLITGLAFQEAGDPGHRRVFSVFAF
jgi:hypothetical protein